MPMLAKREGCGGIAKTHSYPALGKGEWSPRGSGRYTYGKVKTNRAGKRVPQSFLKLCTSSNTLCCVRSLWCGTCAELRAQTSYYFIIHRAGLFEFIHIESRMENQTLILKSFIIRFRWTVLISYRLVSPKFSNYEHSHIGKGKTIPLQAWSGPRGTRKLRFPDFMTTAQKGGKVVSLTHRPHLPPGNSPGTHFC